MQRLREQRDVHARVRERQRSSSPRFHVMFVDAAARGQRAGARQHVGRAIDGDDARAQRAASIVR